MYINNATYKIVMNEVCKYASYEDKVRITEIDEETITFDDGSTISWGHWQDCCENTYADFSQIEDCVGMEFNLPLAFEEVPDGGFRFGNGINMVFVPCYTEQNGYYSDIVDVYYTKRDGSEEKYHFGSEFVDEYDGRYGYWDEDDFE